MYTGIGGCWGLSDQAASVAEEIAMGMAPVGPRRPPDFVRTMLLYPGSAAEQQQQQQQQRSTPPTGDARQAAAAAAGCTTPPRIKLPHAPVAAGDSAPITGLGLRSASVAATVAAMQGHAAELRREVVAAESVIVSRRGGEAAIAAALDRGYVAAQRCSIWRGRVQVRSSLLLCGSSSWTLFVRGPTYLTHLFIGPYPMWRCRAGHHCPKPIWPYCIPNGRNFQSTLMLDFCHASKSWRRL